MDTGYQLRINEYRQYTHFIPVNFLAKITMQTFVNLAKRSLSVSLLLLLLIVTLLDIFKSESLSLLTSMTKNVATLKRRRELC